MKKIVMFAAASGAALTLAACGGGAGEAPAEEPAATEMTPAETAAPVDETTAALDAAAEAAEETDVNGNPVGPNTPEAPAATAEDAPAQ